MRYGAYILSVIEMMLIKALNRGGGVFKALVIAAAAVALTFSSESCKNGVENGVELCLKVLIPSLFPFMALSALTVKLGICDLLGRRLGGITRKIFGMSGTLAPVILLSLIGGYPVGAKGIAELKSSGAISEAEAKRASLFAVCAGPGFLINYVGSTLYGNAHIGMIILLAQVLSVILTGVFLRLFCGEVKQFSSNRELYIKSMPLSNALVESTYSAAEGMGKICALVMIFSAATGILNGILPGNLLKIWIILSEVCSAVKLTAGEYPLWVTAFAVGFGGICVHFQIFSALDGIKINKLLFFLIRIIQGVITALLTWIFSFVFIAETEVFSSGEVQNSAFFGGSIISAAVLAAVMVCFMLSIKNIRR